MGSDFDFFDNELIINMLFNTDSDKKYLNKEYVEKMKRELLCNLSCNEEAPDWNTNRALAYLNVESTRTSDEAMFHFIDCIISFKHEYERLKGFSEFAKNKFLKDRGWTEEDFNREIEKLKMMRELKQ